MKPFSIALTSASALLALTCTASARPQDNNIKITVTAETTGEPRADDAKPEGTQPEVKRERKSVKLQVQPQPIVLLKHINLPQAEGDEKSAELNLSLTADAPPKIWLGIGLKEVTGDLATYLGSSEGVFVEEVFPDSPAASAKLAAGDVIIAFNGEKLSGPADLVKALRKIGEAASQKPVDKQTGDKAAADQEGADQHKPEGIEEAAEVSYPPVTLTLKRQDNELKVELTPGSRPQALAMTARGEPLKDGASFFYFGQPKVQSVNKSVIVMKDENGDVTVQIDRDGDDQPKITLKDAKGERTIGKDDLKALPEKLRSAIDKALKHEHKPGLHVEPAAAAEAGASVDEQVMQEINQQVEKALKQFGQQGVKFDSSMLPEELKKLADGNGVIVLGAEMGEMGEIAKKWAEVGAGKARAFMAVPQEIEELHKQVDELKKQVDELKAELKASKK